jgi:hypothetical protein
MGRKKVKDKAISLTICVRKSVIKANGGTDKARRKAEKALNDNCVTSDGDG